jgi:VWFA-related protein
MNMRLAKGVAPPFGIVLGVCLLGLPAVETIGQTTEQTPADGTRIIRSRVELVTTDVTVRDGSGRFVPDLERTDFEVLEDGARQEIVLMTMSHGGRVFVEPAGAAAAAADGIVAPPPRPSQDVAGRIFLILVDDLHLDFVDTGRLRELMRQLSTQLIREGDMFGVISTGPSSLAVDLTYDRKRLNDAISRMTGAGLAPTDMIQARQGGRGAPEVRHRAHVAFATAFDLLRNLAKVHDRRKSIIYVSNGYDFNPFAESRGGQDGLGNTPGPPNAPRDPAQATGSPFGFADLVSDLAAVTRAANRANATIFTIDPRGLVAGPDPGRSVNAVEWSAHVRTTQDTLRVLAERTGGIATVDRNGFDSALARIDAEASDYYVLAYYSSNPDPLKRQRTINVTVRRPGLEVKHRPGYFVGTTQ